ncbi:hypothetical protein DNH61_11635 [Paenibacillus sambharensis]|uniref:Uncharacterized protein n=1 Tax=Paenibacillus sambharensis TaxID=1803190 RepID=A0A2W1LL34_9BACL|nr:hypothetical protein [Paenibacillus sambharensis]PZD95204.1 hypothetical protein DNH61_11635 [Paenibacillus sambharensis]
MNLSHHDSAADRLFANLQRMGVPDEHRDSTLRVIVSNWTQNVLEAGNEPTLEGFADFYPEWDSPRYTDIVEAEIERTVQMCLQEK